MHKSTVRSMQNAARNGAAQNPVYMRDIYKDHPPQISSADKAHLDFVKFGKSDEAEKIRMVISAAKKDGIGAAAEVSKLLNKLRLRTALGEPWTPRLAWFAAAEFRNAASQSLARTANATKAAACESKAFSTTLRAAIKSHLESIREEFSASQPKLGDAHPGLSDLLKRIQE